MNRRRKYSGKRTTKDFQTIARRKKQRQFALFYFLLFVAIALFFVLFFLNRYNNKNGNANNVTKNASGAAVAAGGIVQDPLANDDTKKVLMAQAESMTVQYDYDGAIHLLQKNQGYEKHQDVVDKIKKYEAIKATLVEVNVCDVPHFFTHPLIYDAKLGFSTDMKNGYQQESLTVNEFNNFLQQMYDNGYVLVNIGDVAPVSKNDKGNKVVSLGKIYLPKGKKAFMFSEDDTNYYGRWQQKGVGSRLIVGENGKIQCQVDLPDGSKIQGDYDVAPCLNTFVEKHPDFAYKNARAMIGVTGIEGVYGYRTSTYKTADYKNDPAIAGKDFNPDSEDAKSIKAVAQCLKDNGFTLASHSFVHGNFYPNGQYCTQKYLKYDLYRFKHEIASLIGEVDAILYPNGGDIEHGEDYWKYKMSNPRFKALYNSGLVYYFNVDTNESSPWGRVGKNYYRGRRVGLIGYTVLCKADYMKKNFNLSMKELVDKDRPLPNVLNYNGTKVNVNCK